MQNRDARSLNQGSAPSDDFHQFDGIDQKIKEEKAEEKKIDGMAKAFHQKF